MKTVKPFSIFATALAAVLFGLPVQSHAAERKPCRHLYVGKSVNWRVGDDTYARGVVTGIGNGVVSFRVEQVVDGNGRAYYGSEEFVGTSYEKPCSEIE
jgi:hypothetical protein